MPKLSTRFSLNCQSIELFTQTLMSSPTPLQSFLGGLGLTLPVHALMLLNGNVFGISGFLHRAVRGGKEAIVAVTGLVLGGVFIGVLEGSGPKPFTLGLSQVLLSGFLVGLGSKVGDPQSL